MRGLSVAVLWVGTFAVVASAGLALYGGIENFSQLMWLGIVLAGLIVAGMVYFLRRAAAEGKPAFLAASVANFHADQTQWFNGTGLAIDGNAGRLLLADRGLVKVYDIASVRSLRAELHVTTAAVGASNPILAIFSLLMLPRMISEQFSNGLYVSVDDPVKPEWHIYGIDAKAAATWTNLIEAEKHRGATPSTAVPAVPLPRFAGEDQG